MGGLSVALGAFGAHVMKNKFSEYAMSVFDKGVYYQMVHSLVIFLTVLAAQAFVSQSKMFLTAGWFFVFAIVIFSGSLYTIAFSGVRAWGAVTPIGGVSFLVAWILLGVAAFRVF